MQPLDRTLRRELERTVQQARDIAEAAAQTTLSQLGVGEPKPYGFLSEAERDLRRRLRGHGRQLGDERQPTGAQQTERLKEEVAYEHWHRMLFARFLAENNLLMYPDPDAPVPVTLAECEELAEMEGLKNGWEVATRYAAQMLPQIFRENSRVFGLALPPEYQQKLEALLADLPPDVFAASDSLGWVYQFWQAKRKEEVNASEVKIGARELPAVTQLFTEPYMVSFLLDNSLGAWWAAHRLSDVDLQNAKDEAELRQKASIPGVPLEYLRFVQDEESGTWTPAAGTFDSWPEKLSDLKILDPCCGSGHFLVTALMMLAPLRQELGGLSPQEAVDAVLIENLHGLEIDQRCVEIAAFALALEAWRYEGTGGYRPLPELNLACSGLSINANRDDWLTLAGNNKNLAIALDDLYQQFRDAPVLGSLINPQSSLQTGTLFELKWSEVSKLLSEAVALEADIEVTEIGVVAKGISEAARILSQEYQLLITNVPYLAIRKQQEKLSDWVTSVHPDTKQNLAVVFVERCFSLLASNGLGAYVCPQNWLFQNTYKEFRKRVLQSNTLDMVATLGSNAFSTPMYELNIMLISIFRKSPERDTQFFGVDLSEFETDLDKAQNAHKVQAEVLSQSVQLANPDSRITLKKLDRSSSIGEYADVLAGISTGDKGRFHRSYWEVEWVDPKVWELLQGSTREGFHFEGRTEMILWEEERGQIYELAESLKHINHIIQNWQRGKPSWGKKGIAIRQMGDLMATIYTGQIYDSNVYAIVPYSQADVLSLWAYTSSPEFEENVRLLNQKLDVSPRSILQTAFDLSKWRDIGEELYPNGLPAPFSDDPTQWIFHGHPCGSVVWDENAKVLTHGTLRTDATVLQVAIARLLGYRWPVELDSDMELSKEARTFVARCAELHNYADKDGIVCIPAVRGERPAADRLLNLLAAAYGNDWVNGRLNQLLSAADHADNTLENWLRDKFFQQHCTLFGQCPFIWHIWDGVRDGFAALVNYHKLDYKGLETLIYTYLGDWISRQKQDIARGVDGAQEKLAAAETLKVRLEQILKGEAPYDIFVRWKPLEEQPIGWNPDLNDGVRLNIRPFMTVQDVGNKGAGVLRYKPNIDWGKDRGRDVETAPWYHLGPELDSEKGKHGDRINDHHLTLAEKKAVRAAKKT